MRHLIQLIENIKQAFFDPNEIYLHGGPAHLQNNAFQRNMRRDGYDSGGLFFVKDTPEGLTHALGYAIKAKGNGGVWYCKINLNVNQVFDFENDDHIARLRAVMDQEDFLAMKKEAENWNIVWIKLPSGKKPEEYLTQAGFRASIVKAKGIGGKVNTFIAVFVPADICIINFVPKDQLLKPVVKSI